MQTPYGKSLRNGDIRNLVLWKTPAESASSMTIKNPWYDGNPCGKLLDGDINFLVRWKPLTENASSLAINVPGTMETPTTNAFSFAIAM